MLVMASAAACGDNIVDMPDEECDDGNVFTGDGCSGKCKTERIALQTFYNSSDCAGNLWKQLVVDEREYVRFKDANVGLRPRGGPYRCSLQQQAGQAQILKSDPCGGFIY
jgi:cysteine-rich repeat protein